MSGTYSALDQEAGNVSIDRVLVKRRRNRRIQLSLLVLLVSCSVTAFLLLNNCGWHDDLSSANSVSLDALLKGDYRARHKAISWLPDGIDGEYLETNDDEWFLAKWPAREARHIVNTTITIDGVARTVEHVTLNKQRTHALVSTNRQSNWRWSVFGRYWSIEIDTGKIEPLKAPGENAYMLSIAQFSPKENKVAFVHERNIYVKDIDSGETIQVTTDGGANIFNGIPDWVYEEEVYSGDSVMWWSPNGQFLAYLRTDETDVHTYPLEMFMNKAPGSPALLYPQISEIKYPKAGTINPKISLWLYDAVSNNASEVSVSSFNDRLITEVLWLGDSNLLVKSSDRVSDTLEISVVDAKASSSNVVRTLQSKGSWFEISQNTLHVPADASRGREYDGYIDTVVVDGFNHLAYFSPANASEPTRILTSGKWELGEGSYQVNVATNEVYFVATKRSSTERHIYKVSLVAESGIEQVTPDVEAVFSASFTSDGSHALISYNGPSIPYQKVVKWEANTIVDAPFIEENNELRELVEKLHLGEVIYTELEVEPGVFVNVREIRPSSFSKYTRHPVLFFNYGGPGSQQVVKTFTLDFQRVFAETHNAVVVTVDPRGTGFKGVDFRSVVRDKLGHYESHDVIAVAKDYSARRYIAQETMSIWGWSYGGYLTLKTLEQDGGETFKFGAAVAPVTDFRFYDSIYTERYMHTPQTNPRGYNATAVSDVSSLGKCTRFLIMHGTGDDNVHLQNTLSLVDQLDEKSIGNYDLHFYPDSNHAISFHNANPMVYHRLDQWLWQQHFHASNPDFDF